MASTTQTKKMKYGTYFQRAAQAADTKLRFSPVRLGNSGLKISQIILGMMSYGDSRWQEWVLGEEEGIAHVKAAFVLVYVSLKSAVTDAGIHI